MRATSLLAFSLLVLGGCSDPATSGEDPTDGGVDETSPPADGGDVGTPDGGGDAGVDAPLDATADTTPPTDTGPTDTGTPPIDGGSLPPAGNPDGKCLAGLPAGAALADVSKPTAVVGTGTAASCTFAALKAAVNAGGIVTFDCGASPVTIPVTATLDIPTTKDTVIDGGNKVILDGGGTTQILRWYSADFRKNDRRLTLQRLNVINGKATPTKAIPPAPAPCSQGWEDGQGGALFMRDGNLTIIDSVFANNQAAPLGPDTGGGAVYVLGSKNGALVVKSTFKDNKAANAGALGGLFCPLAIYDSLFTNNQAIGNGANSDDASKCSVIHAGQHQVGSGGNGGAIYSDGASVNVSICGTAVLSNAAGKGAFGGGLFFTSNDFGGTLTITDTTMSGNTGGYWTVASTGTTKNAGTAVGTNCKSLTIVNSKLQGL